MRKLVISDIHGAYNAMLQVLDRASFNPEEDQLIFLGDVCDGYPDVTECIQYLSEVPNLIQIMGNHDYWTKQWLENSFSLDYRLWYEQGGAATIASIEKHKSGPAVLEFLKKSKPYHVDNHKAFTHGGFEPTRVLEDCDPYDLMWDRSLPRDAKYASMSTEPLVTEYDEVFIGHTPTVYFDHKNPIHWNNVWIIDTGASYPKMDGRLSVIDVDTKEVWQSDMTRDCYPGVSAR